MVRYLLTLRAVLYWNLALIGSAAQVPIHPSISAPPLRGGCGIRRIDLGVAARRRKWRELRGRGRRRWPGPEDPIEDGWRVDRVMLVDRCRRVDTCDIRYGYSCEMILALSTACGPGLEMICSIRHPIINSCRIDNLLLRLVNTLVLKNSIRERSMIIWITIRLLIRSYVGHPPESAPNSVLLNIRSWIHPAIV